MVKPLVSVITPTWDRHDWLLNRCIPSVQAQTYPHIEHIVLSDGPDPVLMAHFAELKQAILDPQIVYHQTGYHDPAPHWAGPLRRQAIELAQGELIAYLDDDDRFYPKHCDRLAAMFEDPDVDWAYSQMYSHGPVADCVIAGPPREGSIGTPMLMHRAELLKTATWGESSQVEDWNLVKSWLDAGTTVRAVSEITCEVWPSAYR